VTGLCIGVALIAAACAPQPPPAVSGGQPQADALPIPDGVPGVRVFVPFDMPIAADGDLSDWAAMAWQPLANVRFQPENPAQRPAARFALAADLNALYLAVEVTDPAVVPSSNPAEPWRGDAIEVNLDWSGDENTTEYVPGVAQFFLTPAMAQREDAQREDATTLALAGRAADQLGTVRGRVVTTAAGWAAELAIPFHGRMLPAQSASFGIALSLTSARTAADGTPEADAHLYWSAADRDGVAWQNPAVFGQAVFFAHTPQGAAPALAALTLAPQPVWPGAIVWRGLARITWDGFKRYYLDCGPPCGGAAPGEGRGLVFDPAAEYTAVSEGIGYGTLLAVMMDDQAAFDRIYDAAHRDMLDAQTGLMHWRANAAGEIVAFGAATDADIDLAAALLMAGRRVETGGWPDHETRPYTRRALQLLDDVYAQAVIADGWLRPGLPRYWGPEVDTILNPSYFAPAWYRLFDAAEGGTRWSALIAPGYAQLENQPGAPRGLAPDWMLTDGTSASALCARLSGQTQACRFETAFDALRVAWRVGLDCLWFDEPRACDWSRRTAAFLAAQPGDRFGRLYSLDGETVLVDYDNEAMLGMWLTAAMAAEDRTLTDRFTLALYNFGDPTTQGHWWIEPRFYYNHALALFGSTLYSGDFTLVGAPAAAATAEPTPESTPEAAAGL
jgi:endo-1,4-beta-D-glucanase Y